MDLPPFGRYATGIFYLDKAHAAQSEAAFEALAKECALRVICWRTVPTDSGALGMVARGSEPFMRQAFVTGEQEQEALTRQVRTWVLKSFNQMSLKEIKMIN